MQPITDPRDGDAEDDASSTRQRSLLALAGSLLAEISLPKLVVAWLLLIGLPGLLLGLAPLLASIWLSAVSTKVAYALSGAWSALVLAAVVALGWFGGRRLFRIAEGSFWALASLAVQPVYAMAREALRHLAEAGLASRAGPATRARLRAATAAVAGIAVAVPAVLLVAWLWPATRWTGTLADLAAPLRLASAGIANGVVLVAGYFAAAAAVWGFADATMDQPRTRRFEGEPAPPDTAPRWRIVHLSDIHVVGEPYGFRIECGRAGPRGDDRLHRVLARIAAIHAAAPLDLVLITGDVTDAGRSGEWAAFFDALAPYPAIAARLLIQPGNHDVNVVDRANPARLDLPFSPVKRLRQVRALSAMAAVQGGRVRVVDLAGEALGDTLDAALAPHRARLAGFADTGALRDVPFVADLWARLFPMVLPPERPDGLGIVLLDSNADTHFSFTNALGLVSTEQMRGIEIAIAAWPAASWLVALHHHVVEYPMPAKQLSERIGTALVNGSWFVRRLQRIAPDAVVMHGHRHVDWIGACGDLTIVSAPSPVMEATDDRDTAFYVHTLTSDQDGRLHLLAPERIVIPGDPSFRGAA
ncbi:metallophosphoesterase [Rhodoplanes sp. TEM]|uniref:Metallophosphoesterase n=1 Tax=Rhodoplanes tepidamans TaxID=200616 RepID=A0ABT5J8N0_RHOTP|nr:MULTISPECIES: metallophosphoesterase [Rhodoplanes]MDC7786013.1 metallophosphoesterase [Rhodoplanes tepidamans]MDC7984891.1 metallophosphoesterase [Rhodoplanes sp. TEM]MDQ0357019.1 ABC-type amino acid transport substrate-binding protein [Rhodoplanes tepidamans]